MARLSRAIRWHRRGIGIAAAVVCLFACLSVLSPEAPESAPVVVAGRDLPAGTRLAATDLRVVLMPVEFVPSQALDTPEAAVGRTLTAALTSGSAITAASTLNGRESEGADERLVPFRVPDAATVSLLQVGDIITVVGATVDGGAVELATGVRVAALPAGTESSLGAESGALVVVAADAETAAELAAAASQMRMTIVLG